ncbi:hypothetical protein [Leptothoe spongobia]|uniref:Uncharacterized protein n=1 Tax=Leptothoe spongobia TAU-MAC 1115 TaxID=1967444 RepID=A0A947DI16_9CYAN|nr:hypothetical protein [Leptothoe spongobia]MBT9317423.1 hypothetical protein [Leptothoe spongobia TAU-MAC 1115]
MENQPLTSLSNLEDAATLPQLLKYQQSPIHPAITMASLEQIQQELQILPQEALNLVYQFIQFLKKGSQPVTQQNGSDAQEPGPSEGTVYEQFKASGWIGCMSAEEELSVNYTTETADDTPLTSLIGAAPGNFATPAAADQFIRQERDEWDC